MGISGTGLAKEASDIILVDDNFETIVHCIEEGLFNFFYKFSFFIL